MNEMQLALAKLTRLAHPYLEKNDLEGLAAVLREDWSPECLEAMLTTEDSDSLQIVILCLGLLANAGSAPGMARLLHHENDEIVTAAENALWTCWFAAAGPIPQRVLTRIASDIRYGDTNNVIAMLGQLIRAYPQFAEAYHQRSQAYYLQNDYEPCLRDAARAFELNPLHFAARANQGHALSALGRNCEALIAYRDVLRLHPRQPGINETIYALRQRLAPIPV